MFFHDLFLIYSTTVTIFLIIFVGACSDKDKKIKELQNKNKE